MNDNLETETYRDSIGRTYCNTLEPITPQTRMHFGPHIDFTTSNLPKKDSNVPELDTKESANSPIKMQQIKIEKKIDTTYEEVKICTKNFTGFPDTKNDLKTENNQCVKNNELNSNVLALNGNDKAQLDTIIKYETKGTLTSRKRFCLLVFWICICQFTVGFNQGFIGAFVVTLTNKNNFDWEKNTTEYKNNVALLTSLWFLGCALGTSTINMYLQFNQKNFLALLHVSVVLVSGLVCIPNDKTFIIGRLLIGYIAGLFRPASQTLLFQLTPPTLRQKPMAVFSMFLNIG